MPHALSASAKSKQERFCLQLFWAGVNLICLLSRSASGESEQKSWGRGTEPSKSKIKQLTVWDWAHSQAPQKANTPSQSAPCQLSSIITEWGKHKCVTKHMQINLTGQKPTNKYHWHENGGIELIWLSALKSCWPNLLQTSDISDMLAHYPRILVTFSVYYSNTKINFTQRCGHYRD